MDNNSHGNGRSSHQNQKLSKVKATWTIELHKSFVDLCHSQIKNKKGTFFTKESWTKIVADFNKINGKDYDKKQMKNHWDATKVDWKIWYKLKDFESGLGWDEEHNIVRASDEWWEEYIQGNPDAVKFRYKGIDHSDKLTEIFLEGLATGKGAWAPSQGSLPNDNCGPYGGAGNSASNAKLIDSDSDCEVQDEAFEADLDSASNMKNNNKERKYKKNARPNKVPKAEPRRRPSPAVSMTNHLDRICSALEFANDRPKSEPKKEEVTIKYCMTLLRQLEEITKGSDLYFFACDLFMIKEQREMFAELDPSDRQPWLERAKNKSNN